MSLETTKKFLVPANENVKLEIKEGGSKLVLHLKKLIADVEVLQTQKNDTSNLKTSYKAFIEEYNANAGILSARIDALEELVKKLVARLEDIENF